MEGNHARRILFVHLKIENKMKFEVIDLLYGDVCFEGTHDECEDFVARQSDYFTYKIVSCSSRPVIDPLDILDAE